jgi:hypothetical protein
MSARVYKIVVAVLFIMPFVVGAAMGDMIHPLQGDPVSDPAWSGTQHFSKSFSDVQISADVDYAVYPPGKYALSSDQHLNNPTDPSGGSDYVYAYQIWNSAASNSGLDGFSMGFSDLVDNGHDQKAPANIGFLSGFGLAPSSSYFVPLTPPAQSGRWDFNPTILSGGNSTILLYTSKNGPEWDRASILGGGLANTQNLPNPTPEPATWILLITVAAGGLILARRR